MLRGEERLSEDERGLARQETRDSVPVPSFAKGGSCQDASILLRTYTEYIYVPCNIVMNREVVLGIRRVPLTQSEYVFSLPYSLSH